MPSSCPWVHPLHLMEYVFAVLVPLGSSPAFDGVRVARRFSVLCGICFSLRPASCVPNVASFSGLSILDCSFDFL